MLNEPFTANSNTLGPFVVTDVTHHGGRSSVDSDIGISVDAAMHKKPLNVKTVESFMELLIIFAILLMKSFSLFQVQFP
jgi:hypothetical protein